jgi:hypothetical protein
MPKKKAIKAPVDINKELTEALRDKPSPKSKHEAEADETPQVGDRVRVGSSDSEYLVTSVGHGGTTVNLNLPGTNLERFRVPVANLTFVEKRPRKEAPVRKSLDVEALMERVDQVQHSTLDNLSGEIAVLKKYLKTKHVPGKVSEELDRLCEDTEARWKAASKRISELLNELG